jgi:ABC-type antimicrobial peptide transport system permease subunit
VGLAISLTACILIMLWVWDELSFDRFHENASQIYRVNQRIFDRYSNVARESVAPAAAAEMPEIENTCRVGYYFGAGFWEYGNQRFYTRDFQGEAVDDSFFDMFDFEIVKGNTDHPFTDHLSMIITETKAKIIFGDDDPIGKLIQSSHGKWFHITGVMRDLPKNTHFRFDYLVPFVAMQLDYQRAEINTVEVVNWRGNSVQTYFQLNQSADAALVADKIGKMATLHTNKEEVFILQPLSKLHLFFPDGQPAGIQTVRLLGVIAGLILLIACINYVNLVTARVSKRIKEISIKKLHGGKRKQLMVQLIGETALLLIVALTISTFLVYSIFPLYNKISDKEMELNLLSSSALWVYGITTVFVLLLAGLYPAIHLSSFKPLDVFRVGLSGRSKHDYLRKTLVVVQYVFSFGLITAMIVFGSQLNYMHKKDLGYEKANVFTFMSRGMYMHYETVKNELMKNPNIMNVSGTGGGYSGSSGLHWDGKESNDNPFITSVQISHDYFQLMNIQLASGEYLSENDNKYILVNEKAVSVMRMDHPIGKRIWSDEDKRIDFIIKGVVKDYHFENLRTPIKPLMISLSKYPFDLYVKTVKGGEKIAIVSVEKLWKEYDSSNELRYHFLDDEFDLMYKAELRVGKLLYIFAFIAIFVSCLGLFGLVTYTAETKTREIGIRKVFGASERSIITMLLKDFLILVGIAMLIAFPLAYYFLDRILQDYAYRIHIGWWMFALAGVITITFTLLTVGWQALKAATTNPVKSIKSK